MSSNALNSRDLTPFGAQICDVQITDIGADQIHALKLAVAQHGVLVFKNQTADDPEFLAFLKRLGPMTFTAGEIPVDKFPMLNIVSNVGRTTPPRSVFHTDTSYVPSPPAYTALRAVNVPDVGGETLFSDQYLAYDTLPAALKTRLADALVLHALATLSPQAHAALATLGQQAHAVLAEVAEPALAGASTRTDGETSGEAQPQQSWHRLFQRHPLSGRVALYLSTPARCQAILNVPHDEARHLITLLYEHATQPAVLLHHRWQPGDMVLWDNRCTMHRADHNGVVGERVLHRGLVLA